jgi:hypothetical protein
MRTLFAAPLSLTLTLTLHAAEKGVWQQSRARALENSFSLIAA